MRSHHKHNSTESQRDTSSNNGIDVTDHHEYLVQLKRSNSTPSLKRCWLCQSCKVLNNSVTWHCLNCECVSVVAPIYKDTLQKGCIRTDTTANNKDNTNSNNNIKCKTKSIINSVSCNKLAIGAMNQLNEYDRLNRFSHRQMDLCPVLVAANHTTTGDCYVKQVKYNEVTRYRPVGGLCPLNRHLENKSLPNIVDAFNDPAMPSQELSDNFFGERIFTVNKPNPLTTNNPIQNHGINSARKSQTPAHEIHKFTRFATKSAARESVVKKMCTPGEACRMCNLGRCQNDTFSSIKNQSEHSLDTSRFTITTLSRNNAVKSKDKNQTLSRNGGVLIAVRDWSMEKCPVPKNNGILAAAPMSPDSYYEILRNPNNNSTLETNKDCNRLVNKAHIYENSATKLDSNGPIYAVVNKQNKIKNLKPQAAQAVRSPEQTKFTYIGISPTSNAKSIKPTIETDTLYASVKSSQHNNNLSNNNNGLLTNVMPSLNSVNNNNNGVSSNDCTPPATNVDYSTKVWKGSKKPIETNKK